MTGRNGLTKCGICNTSLTLQEGTKEEATPKTCSVGSLNSPRCTHTQTSPQFFVFRQRKDLLDFTFVKRQHQSVSINHNRVCRAVSLFVVSIHLSLANLHEREEPLSHSPAPPRHFPCRYVWRFGLKLKQQSFKTTARWTNRMHLVASKRKKATWRHTNTACFAFLPRLMRTHVRVRNYANQPYRATPTTITSRTTNT